MLTAYQSNKREGYMGEVATNARRFTGLALKGERTFSLMNRLARMRRGPAALVAAFFIAGCSAESPDGWQEPNAVDIQNPLDALPSKTKTKERVPRIAAQLSETAICDSVDESVVRDYVGVSAAAWNEAKTAAGISSVCKIEDEANKGLSKQLGFIAQGLWDIEVGDVAYSVRVSIQPAPQGAAPLNDLVGSGFEALPVDVGYQGVYSQVPSGGTAGALLDVPGFRISANINEFEVGPYPRSPIAASELPDGPKTAAFLMEVVGGLAAAEQ